MKKKITTISLILLFLISLPGSNSIVENYAEREHVQYQTEIENYNPTIIEMAENSGVSSKMWSENKYTYEEVENFIDNRKVVDHYETKPQYGGRSADAYSSKIHIESDLSDMEISTLEHLESTKDEEWWLEYLESAGHGRAKNFSVEPNDKQNFEYGFQYFQGFTNWMEMNVHGKYGSIYNIPFPTSYGFLIERGEYKTPVYKEENYTRWRTTTFENKKYESKGWERKKIDIAISSNAPKNFLKNSIKLRPQANNEGLEVKIDNNTVKSKSAERTLKILPKKRVEKGKYPIFIRAYNSENEKIDELTYSIRLKRGEIPENKHRKIDEEVSEKKPDEEGGEGEVEQKKYVGVKGEVYSSKDGEELIQSSNGVKVKVEREGFSGTASWLNQTQYVHRNYTYIEQTWNMKLKATADGYYRETAKVTDSTDSLSCASHDFTLKPDSNIKS